MKFKDFFAISPSEIKSSCIICQNRDMPLFTRQSGSGFFVKTSNAAAANVTIIALKNNFLAGDTVLYLKESGCKRLFLFGSCGGCGDVESGDIVLIDKAYNLESFSKMLSFDTKPDFSRSSEKLSSAFYEKNLCCDLTKTDSACVSSLLLESKYAKWFKENGISAIDMESSIVLAAAKEAGIEAACFMYVADHIELNPVGKNLEEKIRSKISSARKKLARMILEFADER